MPIPSAKYMEYKEDVTILLESGKDNYSLKQLAFGFTIYLQL